MGVRAQAVHTQASHSAGFGDSQASGSLAAPVRWRRWESRSEGKQTLSLAYSKSKGTLLALLATKLWRLLESD